MQAFHGTLVFIFIQEISLSECQSTHRTIVDDMKLEVISFYPGVSCEEAKCGLTEMSCTIDDREYMVGDKAVLGCQECTCMSSGQFVCRYVSLAVSQPPHVIIQVFNS